jgi:hypothetical protein
VIVVLVERFALLPQPLGDVQVVLGAAALELGTAVRADVGQDAGELVGAPAARVKRGPIVGEGHP